jgi:hypothetical protein
VSGMHSQSFNFHFGCFGHETTISNVIVDLSTAFRRMRHGICI